MANKKQKQFWKRRLRRIKRWMRLAISPQKANHYRPYIVRRIPLLMLLAVVMTLQLGYNYSKTGEVLGRSSSVTVQGLLNETNKQRQDSGLQSLKLSSVLNEAAADKAHDMIKQDYWNHNAPDGTEPWVWLDKDGYSYTKAGENLAKNFSTSSAVVSAWMNSKSHRENMLNPDYQDVGFAFVSGKLSGEPTDLVVAFYAQPANWKVSGVADAKTSTHETAANVQLTPAARVGIALQSLTPAALTSLVLIFVALTIAITAHFYRSKLPKQRRESWHRHHGWLKAGGLVGIAFLVILFYSGGQI